MRLRRIRMHLDAHIRLGRIDLDRQLRRIEVELARQPGGKRRLSGLCGDQSRPLRSAGQILFGKGARGGVGDNVKEGSASPDSLPLVGGVEESTSEFNIGAIRLVRSFLGGRGYQRQVAEGEPGQVERASDAVVICGLFLDGLVARVIAAVTMRSGLDRPDDVPPSAAKLGVARLPLQTPLDRALPLLPSRSPTPLIAHPAENADANR